MTPVSIELDRRFRDAAAREHLLDVAYDLVDTPVGPLLVATTDRGLCRIAYDAELPELEALDGRPAFAELEHLAHELPPTERAAVVLRYGYDLDYAEIGAALGSNATAARQAASAGIRRLRRKESQ